MTHGLPLRSLGLCPLACSLLFAGGFGLARGASAPSSSVQASPASLRASSAAAPIPRGEVLHFTFDHSRTYPGTFRDYWVYVPRQYDATRPACLYVGQDGIQFRAPQVFDELIASGEMPVTIGVFVMHGRVRATGKEALDRFNRSFEYDGMGDLYARFLLEELLPDVETKKASDGRALRLSRSGTDHCIGGSSSGAVCAFTAAWERPDAFSRVFSAIGTYTGLRGANNYPILIRKTEPRPIRVFLQDGNSDLNIYGGDWWMANQEMERALTFAGYDVNHVWGTGGHNGQQATVIFADAMRWLWSGWPEPVRSGHGSPQLQQVVAPGELWQPAAPAAASNDPVDSLALVHIAGSPNGSVVAVDTDGHTATISVAAEEVQTGHAGREAVPTDRGSESAGSRRNPDPSRNVPQLVWAEARRQWLVIAPQGVRLRPGEYIRGSMRLHGNAATVAHDGTIFLIRSGRERELGSVVIIPPGKHETAGISMSLTDIRQPSAVALSPDETLLYVADGESHWVYSYQRQPDGALRYGQRYFDLHRPEDADSSEATSMVVDVDGRLYVGTNMGVQVNDQAGRVNCIIPVPGGAVTGLAFGGRDHRLLYIAAGGKVYTRKMRVSGYNPDDVPIRPAPPNL